MMVRRSFGTIHTGHLPEDFLLSAEKDQPGIASIDAYFEMLKDGWDWEGYTAGAFALEEGTEKKRRHIQFYVEHSRKRPSTLAKDFALTTGAVFDRVRNAKGSWDYCTGTGTHEDKPALDRFEFGTPKLHGDTQRADLKLMVGLVLDGHTPFDILKEYPYAYCVHRKRVWDFYLDLMDMARGIKPGDVGNIKND